MAGYRPDDEAYRPYVMPMRRLTLEGGEEIFKVTKGTLPTHGVLKFKYVMQKRQPVINLPEDRYKYLLKEIRRSLIHTENDRLTRTMIKAVAMKYSFTSKQARLLLDFVDDTKFQIDTTALFLSNIIDKDHQDQLMSKLNAIEQRQAERILGDYYYFNPLNCTGHYRINLKKKWDRMLLVELTAVNRKERTICIREGRPDLSQYSNYEYLRNCTHTYFGEEEDEETKELTGKIVQKTDRIIYRNTWEIKNDGIFECDYVSPIRPPDNAEPVDDEIFNDFRGCS